MANDKQNKKASERAFEQAFAREFDLHLAEIPHEIDREQFASDITYDGVKEFYHKVAQRFCAIVVNEVFKGGKSGAK